MSHFAVLVISEKPEDVERLMAPFHEFECTGEDDEYVQEIDMTEEARGEYLASTDTMYRKIGETDMISGFGEDGNYLPEFLEEIEDPIFKSKRKMFKLPEGYEAVEVPTNTVRSFAQWAESYHGWKTVKHGEPLNLTDPKDHKYGYIQLDENGGVLKCIKRTNPNKKWDWWVVGGRWSGFLKVIDPLQAHAGERSWANKEEVIPSDRCDQTVRSNLDLRGMREDAGKEAGELWDKVAACVEGTPPWETWASIRDKHLGDDPELPGGIDAAREKYSSQPAIAALRQSRDFGMMGFFKGFDWFLTTSREDYVKQAEKTAVTTYAVLTKDGVWHAKGEMGWFGMSSDAMTDEQWAEKVGEVLELTPDDHYVTVVDVHRKRVGRYGAGWLHACRSVEARHQTEVRPPAYGRSGGICWPMS